MYKITNSSRLKVEIKRIRGDVDIPKYQTNGAAAVDLQVSIDKGQLVGLIPQEVIFFPTGIAINIQNPDFCAKIYPRSGLGTKGLVLANTVGIIDSDYQGEIFLPLYNNGEKTISIVSGMRVAQMIFERIERAEFEEVDNFTTKTARGVGGFGSTGE